MIKTIPIEVKISLLHRATSNNWQKVTGKNIIKQSEGNTPENKMFFFWAFFYSIIFLFLFFNFSKKKNYYIKHVLA